MKRLVVFLGPYDVDPTAVICRNRCRLVMTHFGDPTHLAAIADGDGVGSLLSGDPGDPEAAIAISRDRRFRIGPTALRDSIVLLDLSGRNGNRNKDGQ
jgi:hypothetical protein